MFTSPRRTAPQSAISDQPTGGVRRRVARVAGAVLGAGLSVGLIAGFVQPAQANTPAQIANLVIHEINVERQAHGLPMLRSSYRLNSSASYHSWYMSMRNTMSHQLSGEPSLGARISRTGFPWRFCAENIAWTSSMSTSGALGVHRSMYGEKAPNDGHRQNILSSNINYVGVSVRLDTRHRKLWIAEDFAHTM